MSNVDGSSWQFLLCRGRGLDHEWSSFKCTLIVLEWMLQLQPIFVSPSLAAERTAWEVLSGLTSHCFYRQGGNSPYFLLYVQTKLAGVFQRWSIFLFCFSLSLFLQQLTSPKWICAIHHSLTELDEQFHYSLALLLYSTIEISKGFSEPT